MLNVESMNARLQHLRERIERLKSRQSVAQEEFYASLDERDVVERNFQVAIECCLDIAKHIVVGRELQRPKELREVFHALAHANLLPKEFADIMTSFASLRNILVHHYMAVEPEKLYTHLQNDIPYLARFAEFTAAVIEREMTQKDAASDGESQS